MPVSVKSISEPCQDIDRDHRVQAYELRYEHCKRLQVPVRNRLAVRPATVVNGSVTTAALNGIDIAYDDTGSGPALMLVHGHPFDRSMWAPQVEAFASRCRVVVPDLRGYGASTVVPGATPLATFAADLLALADHLGIERFVLGGLSMGGQIVMESYRQFPSRVAGLLLADTFARSDDPPARATRRAAADRMTREGLGWYVADNLFKMVSSNAPAEVAERVRTMMLAAPPPGAAAALRGRAERPDYRDLLTTVSVPALVVVGSDDEFTPVSDAEEMHALLPDSSLTVVDGAAHMPNLEKPEVFNAAVRSFLNRVG
jgi:3-oxoadipate enol-lactonase